jgi:hypothetical protein
VSAVAICIIAAYFYIVFQGLYIIYYIYYRMNNNKRYYLYLDAYIDIEKYKRFLDDFQKNIIIKDEQIINKNLCYDKTCSKDTLTNISLFAKASNDIYKARVKTSCNKKNLFISKSAKNIILKLCNYSEYYSSKSSITLGKSKLGNSKFTLIKRLTKSADNQRSQSSSVSPSKHASQHSQHSQHLQHSQHSQHSLAKLTRQLSSPLPPTKLARQLSSWSKGERPDNSGDFNMCLHSDEIIAGIKFSYLVVANITSNLLLFFGFMANCELKDKKNRDLLMNEVDESIILSSYCKGKPLSTLKRKLNRRQVFEVFYTIICCYHYYGFCIQDINLGNFIANEDTFYTTITVSTGTAGGKIFYFPMFQSITIIDYQISAKQKDTIINIKKYVNGLRNLLEPSVFADLSKINNGHPINVLNEFIACECFQKFVIASRDDKKYKGCRNIVFGTTI